MSPSSSTLPAHVASWRERVSDAASVLAGRRIAVLTGAGISTDSGIPDYRGRGAPVRTPMTVDEFLSSEQARQRYWAGSHLGWRRFAAAEPNPAHRAVAAWEAAGLVTAVVTQNVDGLHLRAGTRRLVELHGTMRRVMCIRCGQVFDRRDLAIRLEADNPWLAVAETSSLGPDGDVIPFRTDGMRVPSCSVCGGILKPDVVFFGEFIPGTRFREAEQVVHGAEALLVAGSSLVVNSGLRLVERARRRRLPIVIINRGPTRCDTRATVKIDGGASEAIAALGDLLLGADAA
jgi:NAD-dependent SIR2 family protein deacetylase